MGILDLQIKSQLEADKVLATPPESFSPPDTTPHLPPDIQPGPNNSTYCRGLYIWGPQEYMIRSAPWKELAFL